MNFIRYFHTLRYLQPVQISSRVYRRFYHPFPNNDPAPLPREIIGTWHSPVRKPQSLLDKNRFHFHNISHSIDSKADWNNPEWPKLWLYNLHYFDDLSAADAEKRADMHMQLIERWIVENTPIEGNGWEPYPTSLRIVNWIKWSMAGNELQDKFIQSLAVQVRSLEKSIEYHLLGNHLLANAKALIFSGQYFKGSEAERWLSKGMDLLAKQLPEQILPDGGHFERSPMYHAIILEDLLDLVNLMGTYGKQSPEIWLAAVARMRNWLHVMQHPDGKIVLFNDSAFGICPDPLELEAYAERLGLANAGRQTGEDLVHLQDTGYIRLQQENAVAFLDVAPIGPDYIPGHAHADTLNFELSLFGQRVIVDTGISTYEKNDERQRQRGTAAHNTVTIDNFDSSEVWGGFRVARRAKPVGLEIGRSDTVITVACSHDGYKRLPGKPVHNRRWDMDRGSLNVTDEVSGMYTGQSIARYHFHPEVHISIDEEGTGTGLLPGGERFSFRVKMGRAHLKETTWHPEFNVCIKNRCLEVTMNNTASEVCFKWS